MKKLFLAVLLLASVYSFGQGATLPFPPLLGPNGASIPFAKLTFCTYPATFDTLGNCTNTVTVFQDIGLNTPYPSGIITDGLGNFPPNQVVTTALWFTPAQNYCFTATGSNLLHLVNFCTPFSVSNSVGPGSNPVFGNATLTGNLLLSSTGDVCWNSDSGITRAAAKSFKLGDCSGSSDGTLTLGALNLSGNATVGNNLTSAIDNGVINAAQQSGSDIGAKANAAFSTCTNSCVVKIPAGTYLAVTTTIHIPVVSNGSVTLWIDSGATINYTGSGYAVDAIGTGQFNAGITVFGGGKIIGTSSGLGGIHPEAFNGATLYNINISGFTTGDGWFGQGVNMMTCYGCQFNGNLNGIHNVGVVVSSTDFSSNALNFIGGQVASNTGWGVFEDGALAGTVGPNEKNSYQMVFENNGSNANAATSGNAFIQRCDACSITHSYLEYVTGATRTNNIIIGDGSNAPNAVDISNNIFLSVGVTNAVNIGNGLSTYVMDNYEAATITNFVNNSGTAARRLRQKGNVAQAATTCFTGTNNGVDNDIEDANQGGNCALGDINAFGTTVRGLGFNTISGLNQDLAIRGRSGDTNIVTFSNSSAGSTVASLSDAGAWKPTTYLVTNLLISNTAPTIAAAGCGGAAAAISGTPNGTASFAINVGTTPTAAGCVVTMPAATTGWNCQVTDITTNSTSVFLQKQTATGSSTTQITLVNYSDVAVATAPSASDIWQVTCSAR